MKMTRFLLQSGKQEMVGLESSEESSSSYCLVLLVCDTGYGLGSGDGFTQLPNRIESLSVLISCRLDCFLRC
jgi:hypothetical protein